jgi:hypothetical protein
MATNIKYLKENNLLEAHKHFMRLSEAYIPTVLPEEEIEEAGEDMQDPNAMGGDPNAMGGMPADGGMPQDPNAMGGDPNAMGGDPNAMGGQDMGADPNAMGQPMQDASAPIGPDTGEDPFADQRTGDDEMGGGSPDDGSTIDINGLTHAEDKIYVKQNQIGRDLAKVDNKISSLIDKIAGLQSALDSNSSELENLKAEFEKRNPTQTEKLDIRGALDSYPFNVRPGDYWANKMKEKNNYEVYADNDKSPDKQYTITADEVEDLPSDISDSFKVVDDDIQTLEKMFKL